MDHALYRYSALPTRAPPPPWPGGRRLAAYALLFLEHWELLPPAGALRDPRLVGEFGSFHPDYRSWTQREYGLRIGIYRVLDALQAAGIVPCIAANALALERLPALVRRLGDAGCEWIAHGLAATRIMHSKMTRDEQQAHIRTSLDTVERICGRRPAGWLSQDWGTTPDTFDLLADAGVRYTLDLPNDDQPYWMATRRPLLAIPYAAEWDDVQCQWLRFVEPRAHAEIAATAFERLHEEGRCAVFGLGIHPWLAGMPSRIAALRTLLARIGGADGTWWTSPGAIFDAACA